MIAWIQSLIYPITLLHADLLFFKKRVDFEIGMTGQVVILQKGLNDVFDISQRRIEIVDAEQPEAGQGIFAFVESENNPVYLPVHLTDVFSIGNASIVDFLVCLPGELNPQKDQIASFVNKYKLASKQWKFHWTSSPTAIGTPIIGST